MTDLRQAAQQALVALIDAANVLSAPMFADAADALRKALEQPEQEPVAWTTMPEAADWDFVSGSKDPTGKLEGKWFPLYTIPPAAQPAQEPTPWRDMVVVTLVREGIDKHRARELADHFAAERNNG